jgi:O-antigen biosynthesis protein
MNFMSRFRRKRRNGSKAEQDDLTASVALLGASGLFDIGYYLRQWPELSASQSDAIEHYLKEGWRQNADPGPNFSTSSYLAINGDVEAAGVNPLVHYLKHGKREGRTVARSQLHDNNSLSLIAPPLEDWERLAGSWKISNATPLIDVVVPVYCGFDETMRCLFSVLSAKQDTPYQLVVIDDCGPDTALRDQMQGLAARGLIELHQTPENVGFVKACNLGMGLHSERDIILLNSDTEVFGNWLDRLRTAALRQPKTGTVTPFSNNAEICSYPRFVQDNRIRLEVTDEIIDQLAAGVNAGLEVEIPTGVGFCMYIRRPCLEEIGAFDFENFGVGYGEENDFCRRAALAGWRNILAPNVYVRHHGATSFGKKKTARVRAALDALERMHPGYLRLIEDFVSIDPVRSFREALDLARLARRAKTSAVLFITHTLGGGTERHVQDMKRLLEDEHVPVFFCRANESDPKRIYIEDPYTPESPNLPLFDMTRDVDRFAKFIRRVGINHVHIHHLAGFPENAPDFFRTACHIADLPYDVTIHDYLPVCPRVNLIDRSGVYCGEPDLQTCETCIDKSGSPFGMPSVWEWRNRYERLLLSARRVFAPNVDPARRMARYFPAVHFMVRPHPEPTPQVVSDIHGITESTGLSQKHVARQPRSRRIALLGAIGPHKGSDLLLETIRASESLKLDLEFVVVGYTNKDDDLRKFDCVEVTGRFEEGEAVERLKAARADAVWFPAVWPETYSYTLSAAFEARVFPAAFDLGAIAVRIQAVGWGELMPIGLMLDPAAVAERLANMAIHKFQDRLLNCFATTHYVNLLGSYYGIGSVEATAQARRSACEMDALNARPTQTDMLPSLAHGERPRQADT